MILSSWLLSDLIEIKLGFAEEKRKKERKKKWHKDLTSVKSEIFNYFDPDHRLK